MQHQNKDDHENEDNITNDDVKIKATSKMKRTSKMKATSKIVPSTHKKNPLHSIADIKQETLSGVLTGNGIRHDE